MTTMDRSARAWLVTVSVDHYWRVAGLGYELDDLIQDGHIVWWRVVKKYETDRGRVRARPHLMKIFKMAFLQRIHDLSNACTKQRFQIAAEDLRPRGVSDEIDIWDVLAPPHNLDELGMVISEAPGALRPLLRAMLHDASSAFMHEEPDPELLLMHAELRAHLTP